MLLNSLKGVMKDVFDDKCGDELKEMYTDYLWAELSDNLKSSIVNEIEQHLKAIVKAVPPKCTIISRAKKFYNSRRTNELTKADPEKRKRRKLALKANRLTYVSVYMHRSRYNTKCRFNF